MAIKIIFLLLFFISIPNAKLLCDPFPIGLSMSNLGAILWDKGCSGTQSWMPAAFCDSSLAQGINVAAVSYYDNMDNLQDKYIYQMSVGGFFTYHLIIMKMSISCFNAFETYFEQSLFLSTAIKLFPSLKASIDLRGYRIGLCGIGNASHTIGEAGFSSWIGLGYVGFSLQCDHLILKKSGVDGTDPPISISCGVHTRSNRIGAQGFIIEISPLLEHPLRYKIGEEIRIGNWFGIQAGLANNPVQISLGIVIDMHFPSIALSLVNQPDLGWSKGIFFGYSH